MEKQSKSGLSPLKAAAVAFLPTFQVMLWLLPSSPFASSDSRVLPALCFAALVSIAIALALNLQWREETPATLSISVPSAFRAQILGVEWLPPVLHPDYATNTELRIALGLQPPQPAIDQAAAARLRLQAMSEVAKDRVADAPAEVVASGPSVDGFVTVEAALAHLCAYPDQQVWAMNWRAATVPTEPPEENLVRLILAGPDYQSARKPLALLYRGGLADMAKPEDAVPAWGATMDLTTSYSRSTAADIDFLIHDANHGSDAEPLTQALAQAQPGFDVKRQSLNTPSLPGESGAGTILLGIALATACVQQGRQNVLVAGTRDPKRTIALLVTPAATDPQDQLAPPEQSSAPLASSVWWGALRQ